MPTELPGDQLILAWSSSNLLGASGMGPIAASDGWAISNRDRFGGLGPAARYLPEETEDTPPDAPVPPTCLEFRPSDTVSYLVAKLYSTASKRAGQYQVHAIRVPRGLSSWDLWTLADRGVLITRELAEPPAQLETLSLAPTAPSRLGTDESDVRALSRLLQCLHERQPYLIQTTDQALGIAGLKSLVAYLPQGIAVDVPVSTFVPSPAQWTSGLGLLLPPHSLGTATPDLELDQQRERAGTGLFITLADQLITAAAGGLNPPIGSLAELDLWLAMETSDLLDLSAATLAELIGSAAFGSFLAKLADHPRIGQVLLKLLADPSVEEAFADRLRAEGPEYADLIAAFVAGAGSSETDAAKRAPLQTWLVNAVTDRQFGRYVVPSLLAEAAGRRVEIHSDTLVTCLATSTEADALQPLTFAVGSARWSAVTEAELAGFLADGGKLSPQTAGLLRESPTKVAALIDRRLQAGEWRAGVIGRAAERWPDAGLDELIAILVRSEKLPTDWPVRVLAARPAAVARPILAAQWPSIAAHLGIPDSIAGMLSVPKKPWWKLSDPE
ncbi:MAG: hypothetical protein WAS07_01135 [Micropruina sp.]